MSDLHKAHELGRKLHALAQRGVGGEQSNAEEMLDRLCKKHGITIEDLANELPKLREFTFKSQPHLEFLANIIHHVVGVDRKCVRYRGTRTLAIEMSTAEHLEFIYKAEHYWKLYTTELRVFKRAFMLRNELFTKDWWQPREDDHEPTKEEKAAHDRAVKLAKLLKKERPQKRLERAEKLTA